MKEVLEFLENIIHLLQVKYSGKDDMPSTEDSVNAYKWLIEQMKDGKNKRVAVHKDPVFHNGKIYVFHYLAKYKDELDYWDKHPIMLFLGYIKGAEGKLAVGINISWYPPTARKWLIEKIRELYKDKYKEAISKNPLDAIAQRPVLLDLYNLKMALDSYGLSFAVRTYIPQNMRNPKICLSYEDWDKAIRLDQPRVFPELVINGKYTLATIYKSFLDHVRDVKGHRAEWKESMDKNKKLQRYRFIK